MRLLRFELRRMDGFEDRGRQDHGEEGLALLKRPELEPAFQADPHSWSLGDDLLRLASWALDGDDGGFNRI